MYGSAWFGSVWGGFLGGILGGIARAGFSHRRVLSRTPLIIRTVPQPLHWRRDAAPHGSRHHRPEARVHPEVRRSARHRGGGRRRLQVVHPQRGAAPAVRHGYGRAPHAPRRARAPSGPERSAVSVRAIGNGTVTASAVGRQDRRGVRRVPCELSSAAGGPARARRAGRLPAGRRRVRP